MTGGNGSEAEKPLVRGVVGWCLYDWANSAFPTVIITFVFAAYFTKAISQVLAVLSEWALM